MFGQPKPGVPEKILRKTADQKPKEERLETKLLRAYAKTKLKAGQGGVGGRRRLAPPNGNHN
jgi:hypothetical protein